MKAGKVDPPLTRTVIEWESPEFESATTIVVLSVEKASTLKFPQPDVTLGAELDSSATVKTKEQTSL